MRCITNLIERVWLTEENPDLTRSLFGEPNEDYFEPIIKSESFNNYAYACYEIQNNEKKKLIFGWTGGVKFKPFVGSTNKFKSFIKKRIPDNRKRIAFYFDQFKHSFDPALNSLSLIQKDDKIELDVGNILQITDDLIIWQYQMEKILQQAGFSEEESIEIRKGYQHGKRPNTLEKIKGIKIGSFELLDIFEKRVPPRKAGKLNYKTSEYFYQHYIKPRLN